VRGLPPSEGVGVSIGSAPAGFRVVLLWEAPRPSPVWKVQGAVSRAVQLASVRVPRGGSGAAHRRLALAVFTTLPCNVSPPTALHIGAASGRLMGPGPFVRERGCGTCTPSCARRGRWWVAWFSVKTIPLEPFGVQGGPWRVPCCARSHCF
jgi:hypothetical protein